MDNEFMKNLNKVRDELAEKFAASWKKDEFNFMAYDNFKIGFDAAVKELEPIIRELEERIEKLKEALNSIEQNCNLTVYSHSEEFMRGANAGYRAQADTARAALEDDKQTIGEK